MLAKVGENPGAVKAAPRRVRCHVRACLVLIREFTFP
jgi:hypothetical protein